MSREETMAVVKPRRAASEPQVSWVTYLSSSLGTGSQDGKSGLHRNN